MKRKLLLPAFAILIVCAGWSQDTIGDSPGNLTGLRRPVSSFPTPDTTDLRPVCFPFWMVRELALDLEEKSALEAREALLVKGIAIYRGLVIGLERNSTHKDLQLRLQQRNYEVMVAQYLAEKARKPRDDTLSWILKILMALGAGYLVGAL